MGVEEARALLSRSGIELLWFDSMGAKCASIAIHTSVGIVVVDPGAAEMQPSYPLPSEEKRRLRKEAIRVLEQYCSKATAIIVTHYHYDHHVLPRDEDVVDPRKYWLGKKLVLKNPNMYINESQWERARLFLSQLLELASKRLEEYLVQPQQHEFEDPVDRLSIALSKDFGDYQRRRRELLEKGREWFKKLASMWSSQPWVREFVLDDGTQILWGDGRTLEFGDTVIRIYEPWFHGIEYDRTGWVTPLLIQKGSFRVFYSSDLMGPQIEDYAEEIAKLKPDIVILDGPPTYLFPYMLNRVNLSRAISNAITVVCSGVKLVVYDHHLLREKRWRERVRDVFREAEKCGVMLLTASEVYGVEPLIDRIAKGKV